MKFGKRLAVLAVSSVTLSAMSANAQMAWGTGMAMGQQSCPYGVRAGEGASSYLEDYNDLKKMKTDEEAKLREMKRKLKNLEKSLDKARTTIENSIDTKYSSFITAHIDALNECTDYDYQSISKAKTRTTVSNDGDDGDQAPEKNARAKLTPISGFSQKEWNSVCAAGKGNVDGSICVNTPYASTDRGHSSPNDCKKALVSYRKDTQDYQKTQDDITRSEERIAKYKEDLPEVLRDAKQRYKEDMQAGTEGDVCLTCLAGGSGYRSEKATPDWAGVAANVGVGLLATYMGYQQNKMVAQYNSDLGWPTQAYPAWGYGLPFLANGLYGALGGGIGAGGFGCGGGIGGAGFGGGYMGGMGPFGMGGGMYGNLGMNGPYGYPMGMMGNPYGGGMFGGGMGPWGPGGYGGMGGMGGMGGYPMMGGMAGMAISGGIAMGGMAGGYPMMGGMGMPMGGYAMGGYPMGGMAGMAISGGLAMGGMAGGYPMMGGMGMAMGGYPMGGMAGMATGGMAGGMAGGYPMMGGMGAMAGYPMMGGAIGLAAGGMAGGMAGGYPMMGGMGQMGMGYPMMGSMMDGGLGSMQMQQAMLQMQQQQQQLYMQQYQQQMQSQMARQQTLTGLNTELYNLMYRIQQVQMGATTTGTGYLSTGLTGGIGIGGSYGIGGNVQGVIPAPGNNVNTINNGTTTVPGGVVIPTSGR